MIYIVCFFFQAIFYIFQVSERFPLLFVDVIVMKYIVPFVLANFLWQILITCYSIIVDYQKGWNCDWDNISSVHGEKRTQTPRTRYAGSSHRSQGSGHGARASKSDTQKTGWDIQDRTRTADQSESCINQYHMMCTGLYNWSLFI